jgi:hypothetical protein
VLQKKGMQLDKILIKYKAIETLRESLAAIAASGSKDQNQDRALKALKNFAIIMRDDNCPHMQKVIWNKVKACLDCGLRFIGNDNH